MRLIVTFEPKADESGRGYYRRLACENGLSGLRELAGMAGVARTPGALLNCPEYAAAELDLQPQWTEQASQMERHARSWRALRRSATEAICPCCLRDALYIRAAWEHVFFTACSEHGCRVIDRCPDCGDLLSINRQCIEMCDCGRDLRTIETPASEPAQRWLSSLIETSGRSPGAVTPSISDVDVDKLTDFVRDLCRRFDPGAPAIHKAAALAKTTSEAVEFLAPLEPLINNWPAGFRQHVSARIKAGSQEARTLNKLLGKWYTQLRKICNKSPLQPFLEVVLEVAAKEFDGVILMDTAGRVASQFADALMVADAAKQIGVSWGTLHGAVLADKCAHYQHRLGTRGLVYYVPKSEVARITAARAEWVGEDEACKLAQVPPAVMRLMMDSGIIENDKSWRKDILKGGPIRKASLQALCQSLCGPASQAKRIEVSVVYWADMSARRLGDKQAIQSAMRAAASGELLPVVRSKHLGEIGFDKQALLKYYARPVLDSGLTISQLSKQTGWKWESISHWIDSGLLGATRAEQRGQACRVVTPEDLLAFRSTYIPLADLARSMGTKPSYLSEQLSCLKLVGAQVLRDGARRGGLITVADLGRLALHGSRNLTPTAQVPQ
jgi:hypothetical protein